VTLDDGKRVVPCNTSEANLTESCGFPIGHGSVSRYSPGEAVGGYIEVFASRYISPCPQGCRSAGCLLMAVPHIHWETPIFVADPVRRGMPTPHVISRLINRTHSKPAFRACCSLNSTRLTRIRQTQSSAAKSSPARTLRPLECHRPHLRNLHSQRMRKLLQYLRIRSRPVQSALEASVQRTERVPAATSLNQLTERACSLRAAGYVSCQRYLYGHDVKKLKSVYRKAITGD
jgi:hypothetical protein